MNLWKGFRLQPITRLPSTRIGFSTRGLGSKNVLQTYLILELKGVRALFITPHYSLTLEPSTHVYHLSFYHFPLNPLKYKKVLRERKRHTDRGVSITTRWGTPRQGTPPARSDGGYSRWGTPCWGTPGRGTPPPGSTVGVPPSLGVDRQTDGQTRVKT